MDKLNDVSKHYEDTAKMFWELVGGIGVAPVRIIDAECMAAQLERMVPLVMSMHTDLLLISRFLEEIAEEKRNAVGSE